MTDSNNRFSRWTFESNTMEESVVCSFIDKASKQDEKKKGKSERKYSNIDESRLYSIIRFLPGTYPTVLRDTKIYSLSHNYFEQFLKIWRLFFNKNQGVIISLNIDVHRKLFEDINWGFGAKKMSMLPNAGGQSELSEILSCEIVERILGVELNKTEMEIDYFFMNQPMTDYLVSNRNLSQFALGVSVTRAFSYRRRYTKHDAYRLLSKKLSGINSSTRNILNVRIWKQILHIWCPSGRVANIVRKVYSKLPKEFTSNTIVMLTVVNCKWVFTNNKAKANKANLIII
ncbi:1371_t:CDS:2 [Cetraspora pellucida]|uniref:1371_t:CDS:1 n=1 Tax=Cetraspora pellucida TaxID=1433469 RepID=A0A9N9AYA7_9GLOM|nr:1371_t:CDS:2 [Cetraspora pellucida]